MFFKKDFILMLISATVLAIPMPMLIILGGLAGQSLAPSESLATLPVSFQMLAGLFIISPISLFMGRFGRRNGFLVAASLALFGGLIAAGALFFELFFLLCLGHVFLGGAVASFNLFRFAAAELVEPDEQAKAISITLGSGLIAALLAPEIFQLAKGIFTSSTLFLAGPYLALSGIALVGAIPLFFTRFSAPKSTTTPSSSTLHRISDLKHRPTLLWAMISGVGAAAAMILLMTPTPLAMVGHGFSDIEAGDVIRWHVVAMFAPSFFTGAIIKRLGANKVIIMGAVLLSISGIIALSGLQLVHFYISLIFLGVGWNFSFVGATALLNSQLQVSERPLFQGINDTFIALGGVLASFGSGILLHSFSWGWVAGIAIGLAVMVGLSSLLQLRYARA